MEILAALVGAYLLYRVFQQHDLREIVAAISQLPAINIVAAIVLTGGSYLCLTLSECLSLRYARACKLPLSRIWLVTLASLGIGHSIGLSAVSSGAVRYRMYSRSGLDAQAVAKIMLFSGITVGLGLATLFAATMLLHAPMFAAFLHLSPGHIHAIAAALIAVGVIYLLICWRGLPPLRVKHVRLRLPSASLTIGQYVVGTLNFICIGGALHACLAAFADVSYTRVVTLIILGDAASIVGHVPGGWGVLEYIITHALSGAGVVAGVIVFRAVYYLAPLLIGVAVLLADETTARHRSEAARQELVQRG